jgi:hypothetical protein
VLSQIPLTPRKEARSHSPYKPSRQQSFRRSPYQTCSITDASTVRHDHDSDGDRDDPTSPSPNAPSRTAESAIATSGGSKDKQQGAVKGSAKGKQHGTPKQYATPRGKHPLTLTRQRLKTRPFCTQKCLLGLARGGAIDEKCPNRKIHPQRHIGQQEFIQLIRVQLAIDRGRDADCMHLYLGGAVGALFKLCLSSHGYTLVAKGVESHSLAPLQHGRRLYNRMVAIQGQYIPVCLGMTDLIKPLYYSGGHCYQVLFLSWAGQSVRQCVDKSNKSILIDATATAMGKIHELNILHRDVAVRNMAFGSGRLMILDFERAEYRCRQPLGESSTNKQKRPRVAPKQRPGDFKGELRQIVRVFDECKT